MKAIPLANSSEVAIVDDDDYESLKGFRWHLSREGYARRSGIGSASNQWLNMHRIIACTPQGKHTDHLNRVRLDNRKSNLRVCSPRVNVLNRPARVFGPQLPTGVTYKKQSRRFVTQIHVNGKKVHLGCFKSITPAAEAYRSAVSKHYPEDQSE